MAQSEKERLICHLQLGGTSDGRCSFGWCLNLSRLRQTTRSTVVVCSGPGTEEQITQIAPSERNCLELHQVYFFAPYLFIFIRLTPIQWYTSGVTALPP